jgi:hypothetical protein
MGAEAVQSEHLSCWQCGYELFGSPVNGQCPECGLHLAVSRAERREQVLEQAESKINWFNALSVLILQVTIAFGNIERCRTSPLRCQLSDFSVAVTIAMAVSAWTIFIMHRDYQWHSRRFDA